VSTKGLEKMLASCPATAPRPWLHNVPVAPRPRVFPDYALRCPRCYRAATWALEPEADCDGCPLDDTARLGCSACEVQWRVPYDFPRKALDGRTELLAPSHSDDRCSRCRAHDARRDVVRALLDGFKELTTMWMDISQSTYSGPAWITQAEFFATLPSGGAQ
jgi:hypothetical protein